MTGNTPQSLCVIAFRRPLAVVAAQRRGFFQREGLKVEYGQAPGAIGQMRQLLAGEWDLAHSNADTVMAYVDAEGADLFVFLVLDLGIGQQLVVRPGVRSYEDLRGQTLGVDEPAAGFALLLRKMLAVNGLKENDYQLVGIGGTAERVAALVDGRIAGALLDPPRDEPAVRAGCAMLDRASRYFPLYPGITAIATRRWERGQQDALARYVRALLAAQRWAVDPANRAEAVALLAEELGNDTRAAQLYQAEADHRTASVPAISRVEQALRVVATLRREMTGTTDEQPDLRRYWDPAYMLAADPGLATG